MRKILFGAALALVIVFGVRYCEQIKNVGKLIVTEGNYAQVFTYEDSKKFYVDVLSATKKALVVVNAEATIAYDLSKVATEIDELTKTVRITYIPESELKINPNIEYYDVQQDYLNQFNARDYNIIKSRVQKELEKEVKNSTLYSNAQNRLISELSKIYFLTNSLGWTLEYNGNAVTDSTPIKL